MSLALNGTNGVTYNDGTLQSSAPVGKNLIINGNMQIAQRGTSVTGQTALTYQTVDRWKTIPSGSTYNQSQETVTLGDSVVGDFQYYLKHDVTTGDNNAGIFQRIEDVRNVKEGTVTLSFYAKGTNPNGGSLDVLLRQTFGTGGSSDVDQPRPSFTLTSSWQRFNFTFTIPSFSGKTIGSNSTVDIYIIQPDGDTSTNAWELNITGVQLETGTTATDFEQLQYGTQLSLCQRYFWSSTNNIWVFGNAANFGGALSVSLNNIKYPVRMRASPSISHGTAGNNQASRRGSTIGTFTISTLLESGADSLNLTIYNGGGGLTWSYTDSYTVEITNFIANAEL